MAKKSNTAAEVKRTTTIRLPKDLITAPEPEPTVGATYAVVSCDSIDDPALKMDRLTRNAIDDLASQIDEYDRQIEDLKERKKAAETELGEYLDSSKLRSLEYGDYKIGYVHSSGSSLSQELLMTNGVPSWLLAQCRTRTSYRYFAFVNKVRAAEKRAEKKEAAGNES